MKYGNCLIGLLIIMFTTKERGKIITMRNDRFCPHYLYKTKNYIHHYKLKKDILPFPLCYLLFEGEFVKERAR
jgi:hypothetical protein